MGPWRGGVWRSAVVLSGALAVGLVAPVPASAEVLGAVVVTPTSGTDTTLFGGVVTGARCPAGTDDSFFDVTGSDIGVGAPRGVGEMGFLSAASRAGRGDETFRGASIANLRTVGAGAFSASGRYTIRLRCERGAATSDTYQAVLTYTAGGAGAFTVQAPARPPASPAPSPIASPGSGVTASGKAGGAALPTAPASAVAPAGDPAAGASRADAGSTSPAAASESEIASGGWLALGVLGVGGALALAVRKRGWRPGPSRSARPSVPSEPRR